MKWYIQTDTQRELAHQNNQGLGQRKTFIMAEYLLIMLALKFGS